MHSVSLLFHRRAGVVLSLIFLFRVTSAPCNASEIRVHVIERKSSQELSYRCLASVPEGYDPNGERHWPLILFLHGGGTPSAEVASEM